MEFASRVEMHNVPLRQSLLPMNKPFGLCWPDQPRLCAYQPWQGKVEGKACYGYESTSDRRFLSHDLSNLELVGRAPSHERISMHPPMGRWCGWFMLKSTMFCHVDIFNSTMLTIFGLIQIWECALNWFTMSSFMDQNLTFVTPWFRGTIS